MSERGTSETKRPSPRSPSEPALPHPPVVERARNERDETPIPRLIRNPRTWLALYAVALTLIAFWPVPVDRDAGPMLSFIERLIPVLTYPRIEFLANIALFVPFGLLLTLILTRRWLVLPIAILATVTIECLQAVALSARTPSVLDIIANTAGACLGMLLIVAIETHRDRCR